MKGSADLAADMTALARLHAALDFVVETEQLIAGIRETSARPQPGVMRVGHLLGEARELLRGLLARQDRRQTVEIAGSRPDSGRP